MIGIDFASTPVGIWLTSAGAGAWYGFQIGVNPFLSGAVIGTATITKLFSFGWCENHYDSSSKINLAKKIVIHLTTDILLIVTMRHFNLIGKMGTAVLGCLSAGMILMSVTHRDVSVPQGT